MQLENYSTPIRPYNVRGELHGHGIVQINTVVSCTQKVGRHSQETSVFCDRIRNTLTYLPLGG
jgi:hypothetical protein